MPSYLHELLLVLFRNRATSAADLLRSLEVELPEHDEIRTESSNLSDLKPAEYRADHVSFLVRQSRYVLGVVVEIQLGRDEDKPFTWPAYVANLRARHRCPVCLLVVTLEESVARWAGKLIEIGPGTLCKPWVIGPSNTPVVTELEDAQHNVELAVLSAIEHGHNPDIALAARIACAAMVASAHIDSERSRLYVDLILLSLSSSASQTLKDTMNSLGYEYQSDFARHYFGEGKVEGKAEGFNEGRMAARVELIIKLLDQRFGPLPEEIQTRVRCAQDAQLSAVAERVLTVQTLEQALVSLS